MFKVTEELIELAEQAYYYNKGDDTERPMEIVLKAVSEALMNAISNSSNADELAQLFQNDITCVHGNHHGEAVLYIPM